MKTVEYHRKALRQLCWSAIAILACAAASIAWFGFAKLFWVVLASFGAFFLAAVLLDVIVGAKTKIEAGENFATYFTEDPPPEKDEHKWPLLVLSAIFVMFPLMLGSDSALQMLGIYLPMSSTWFEMYLHSRSPILKSSSNRRIGAAWILGGLLMIVSALSSNPQTSGMLFLEKYLHLAGTIYVAMGIYLCFKRDDEAPSSSFRELQLGESAIRFQNLCFPWENIQSVEKSAVGDFTLFKLWAIPLSLFGQINRPAKRPIRFMIAADKAHEFIEHLVRHAKQARFKGDLRILSADISAKPIEFREA